MRTRSNQQKAIQHFKLLTKADDETATRLLERSEWKIDEAVNLYFIESTTSLNTVKDSDEVIPVTTLNEARARGHMSLSRLRPSNLTPIDPVQSLMICSRLERKWILLNLQNRSLLSHTIDQSIWPVLKTSELFTCNFFLHQLRLRSGSEFHNVVDNYNVKQLPTILIIDPMTGQLLTTLKHLKAIESIFEDTLEFLEKYKYSDYYPNGNTINETLEQQQQMKEDERSIARGKRRFHPTENGLEADNSLKCENKTKKSKDSCSSNSESSSLSYNLHDLKINTKPSNVTPLNLALKLPDGTRKIIELTSESTVRDLRRIIKSLNLKDVEVHITPRDPSILFHIWSTKLIDIGLHNNTLLYINQIHSD